MAQILDAMHAHHPGAQGLIIAEKLPKKLIQAGILEARQPPGVWQVASVLGWPKGLNIYVVVPRLLPKLAVYVLWRTISAGPADLVAMSR